ncbi:MAG: glycosyltransferase family 2 protein [Gammaproteobacteria bacterium]|nr:glycosyltransferase family 2 protein [Gammaproteobacteria bacterium]
MSDPPPVSVVMAVHNEERYVTGAVESILGQSFADFEFLIVDDASTDGTPGLLEAFAVRDPRIRILTNPTNLGLTKSLNVALTAARGHLVARMDADDLSFPPRLERQVGFLQDNADYLLCGTGYQTIDENGRVQKTDIRGATPSLFEWDLFFGPPLAHPSAMFRRLLPDGLPVLYDETLLTAQDYGLWCTLAKRGKGVVLPEVLVGYRMHSTNISTTKRGSQAELSIRIARDFLEFKLPGVLERHPQLLAFYALYHGQLHTRPEHVAPSFEAVQSLADEFIRRDCLNAAEKRIVRRLALRRLVRALFAEGQGRRSFSVVVATLRALVPHLPVFLEEGHDFVRRRLVGVPRPR